MTEYPADCSYIKEQVNILYTSNFLSSFPIPLSALPLVTWLGMLMRSSVSLESLPGRGLKRGVMTGLRWWCEGCVLQGEGRWCGG